MDGLRRWLPRHLIDRTSDQDIQEIVLTTNLTPRKCLGFKTSFQTLLAGLGKDVQISLSALRRAPESNWSMRTAIRFYCQNCIVPARNRQHYSGRDNWRRQHAGRGSRRRLLQPMEHSAWQKALHRSSQNRPTSQTP
jgi:hypothetical protein